MIPSTPSRVPKHTATHLNQRIQRKADERLISNRSCGHDDLVRRLVELSLFRRLGVRTSREIDEERNALKALRGDFRRVTTSRGRCNDSAGRRALRAARR